MRTLAATAALGLVLAGAADAAPRRFLINRINVLEPISAVGTEPFWGITFRNGKVKWWDPADEKRTGTVGKPELSPGKAVFRGTVSGLGAFTMTITGEDCSDGMSDFTYPLTAKVEAGDWTMEGCASTVAAFKRRDRSGRDEGEIR